MKEREAPLSFKEKKVTYCCGVAPKCRCMYDKSGCVKRLPVGRWEILLITGNISLSFRVVVTCGFSSLVFVLILWPGRTRALGPSGLKQSGLRGDIGSNHVVPGYHSVDKLVVKQIVAV